MGRVAAGHGMVDHRRFLPVVALLLAGCYAPLHSPGIAAHSLPDDFRYPMRSTVAPPINFSTLSAEQPSAYLLGSGDVLDVVIPDLIAPGQMEVMQVTVVEQGQISLPRVGPIAVGGLSLADAQDQVNRTLAAGYLQNPRATLRLVQKGTINVLVLGAVKKPGVHGLPRYENDVAHALAAAEGFTDEAGDVVEVHRREALPLPVLLQSQSKSPTKPAVVNTASHHVPAKVIVEPLTAPAAIAPVMPADPPAGTPPASPPSPPAIVPPTPPVTRLPARRTSPYSDYRQAPAAKRPAIRGQSPLELPQGDVSPSPEWIATELSPASVPPIFTDAAGPILRIPLRGDASWVRPEDVILQPGDVVIVPQRAQEVFFVVGPLSEQNRLRFAVGDRDREIGGGLLLPRDREIDVVTAVAMAGYIDPIESPTTVTLHRVGPDGMPMLILIDLIAARTDPQETLLVQPGDIIYLNPDCAWYTRRLIDRVIDQALGVAIGRWLTN